MQIRFLQTIASENPGFPFQAGQVIHVTAPSPYLLELLDGVRAEVVRDEASGADEAATLAPSETTVQQRPKRRGRR